MHPYSVDLDERKKVPAILALISVPLMLGLDRLLLLFEIEIPWWIDSPSIILICSFFHFIFDRYLWRCSVGKLKLSNIPNLNGEWKGKIISSYGEGNGVEYDCKAVVTQNWSTISVIFEAESSRSKSITASFRLSNPSEILFTYLFLNQPNYSAVETMNIFYGTTMLIMDKKQTRLAGNYYTGRSRRTFGEMDLDRVN